MSGGVLKTPAVATGASVMKRASAFKGHKLPTSPALAKKASPSAKGGALMTKACGVLAVIDYTPGDDKPASCEESHVRGLCDRMGPRGPDGQGYGYGKSANWHWSLGHQRLSIMDPTDAGNQPFVEPDIAVAANGEIYNFRALYDTLPEKVQTVSDSDSEVLMHLYRAFGSSFVPKLDGMFAFVLVDQEKGTFLAARDHVGIKPLYMGKSEGKLMFASELKCLVDVCDDIEEIPNGTYYTPEEGFVKFYNPAFLEPGYEHDPNITAKDLRDELEVAVVKRMMSDVEFGLFLSGGIDSCIVGTLMRPHVPASKRLPSFCVGMADSPDITAAREIAKQLGYDHSERIFTADEACSIIDKVIYHLETYNAELIRSSIPNYFLAEFASKQVKMCLTGEGSDELFGGYVYFSDAPDKQQFQGELNRIYSALGNVNLKRADRMTMAHGLEARVPFLDVKFTAKAMSLDPKHKMIGASKWEREKAYLRNMFKGEIPEEILWRQKAMQCEGVGEGWVQKLQQHCEALVPDDVFAKRAARFPYDTPHSKEEYFYRDIFESHFAGMDKFTHVWEGGCRAGGASWKSEKYTRAGLVDVGALSHGLQSKTWDEQDAKPPAAGVVGALGGGGAGSATKSVMPTMTSGFGARTAPPATPGARKRASGRAASGSVAAPFMTAAAAAADVFVPPERSFAPVEEVLIAGADERTDIIPELGVNSYNTGPFVMKEHLVRSSCTCNPLTPLAAHAVQTWHPVVMSSWPMEFASLMENCVRRRLSHLLQLPEGTGVITAPSGTDIELIPVVMAKSLFPETQKINMLVSAVNEIGKGVAAAAGGEFSAVNSPAASYGLSMEELTTQDLTELMRTVRMDARDENGNYIDRTELIAQEVADAKAKGEPLIVHTVFGTKTNKREPFPEGTGCEHPEASAFVVVDACQGRYSVAELHELLAKGAVVTITGSKAMSGPPFSGAILIPPALMARLQAVKEEAVWMPPMLEHYFTRHDFPPTLPSFRAHMPLLQNKGLALRWLGSLEEMEAYFNAGGDTPLCRERVAEWAAAVESEIVANHPQIDMFESNGSVLNVTVTNPTTEQRLPVPQLRKLYDLLSVDACDAFAAAGVQLSAQQQQVAATKALIGQPVRICESFGIVRLALGAPDMRALMEDMNVRQAVVTDAAILSKMSLIAQHAQALLY